MRFSLLWLLLPLQAGVSSLSFAEDLTLSGHAKVMFIVDQKEGGRFDQHTFGIGGKLALTTPEYQGFQVKLAGYTTQDLGHRNANPKKVDAYLFDVDKRPYSLLGEAQLRYQHAPTKTTLTLGRQTLETPLMESYDYRIIPNLYEAYTVENTAIPHTKWMLSYVSKMSGLDGVGSYSEFRSLSQQAYTSFLASPKGQLDTEGNTLDLSKIVGHQGVILMGAQFEQEEKKWAIWNAYGQAMLNTFYAEAEWKNTHAADWHSIMGVQGYRVQAVGGFQHFLKEQGLNARYGLYGVKTQLKHQPSGGSLAFAYNAFTGDERTVTAQGNWGGYPEYVSMPYLFAENQKATALADSRLSRWTLGLDLGAYGWKKHQLHWSHTRIRVHPTMLPQANQSIHTFKYRAQWTPKLSTYWILESRNSSHARYDNQFSTVAIRYDF